MCDVFRFKKIRSRFERESKNRKRGRDGDEDMAGSFCVIRGCTMSVSLWLYIYVTVCVCALDAFNLDESL